MGVVRSGGRFGMILHAEYRVVAVAEHEGYNITDLSVSEPTLETVFINLTGKELRD